MKTFLFSIVLFGLTIYATAQIVTNQPARLKNKITCYEGKIGSGAAIVAVDFAVKSHPGSGGKNNDTSPGHESELKWTFIGREGGKDVYRFTFTRMTKAGSSDKTTTAKEVHFDGKQIIVFEEDLHTVVMESPNAKDLKTARGR